MRNFLLILFVFLSAGKAYSQYNSEGKDLISRFHPGTMWFYTGLRPATPEKVRKYDGCHLKTHIKCTQHYQQKINMDNNKDLDGARGRNRTGTS